MLQMMQALQVQLQQQQMQALQVQRQQQQLQQQHEQAHQAVRQMQVSPPPSPFSLAHSMRERGVEEVE